MRDFLNRLANPAVRWLLRSPLHPLLSGSLLLLSVTGRRSGAVYTTPVGYRRDGETLTIQTLHQRTWWKNLRGGASVTVLLRGQARRGIATVAGGDPAAQPEPLTIQIRLTPAAEPTMRATAREGSI